MEMEAEDMQLDFVQHCRDFSCSHCVDGYGGFIGFHGILGMVWGCFWGE